MHDHRAHQVRPPGILPGEVTTVGAIDDEATGEVLPEAVLNGLRCQLDQIHRLADLIPETLHKPTEPGAV